MNSRLKGIVNSYTDRDHRIGCGQRYWIYQTENGRRSGCEISKTERISESI